MILRLALPLLLAALVAPVSGCGAVIVTKTVTGAGSLVVGSAVGAARLTGAAAGAVVGLAVPDGDEAE
ncbi:hypothetical protein LL06_26695 [Hoeflea sp. BAL378]|uniref:hypothetical protein n=1 Tax=Hoeflea sp. BAL378 TaxID=1547437 RepID=UPI0005130ACA|nr:hypothetical protein [Hoeflea sp. BAL378]KGF66684.1 hypothetical protein LL06_26695 [Hoeflea sp. BAL378]